MPIVLTQPGIDELHDAVPALREWQSDGALIQLHPGDVGWFWRFGPAATAEAVRIWTDRGRVRAVGLLDGARLMRVAIAPDAHQDEELARRLVEDMSEPARGVLPPGRVNIEAPAGALIQDLLAEDGWGTDEPWTPLRRHLADPVGDPGVRVEVVGPEQAAARVEVHRASFDGSVFGEDGWRAMASGVLYTDARCLLGYDERGTAVAAVTVWSAGPGRPGLLEPMGVHRDHRGRGHGTAITVAAAAALRDLGSSTAVVCTPTSLAGAVATYRAAGFEPLPEVRDRYRATSPDAGPEA